jgi:integrase
MSKSVRAILWKYSALKDGSHPVKLELTTSEKERFRTNVGVSVDVKHWKGEYPIYVKPSDPDHQLKNEKIIAAIRDAQHQSGEVRKPEFWIFFDLFIEERRPKVGKKRVMEYQRTRDYMKRFQRKSKYIITYESINTLFLNQFVEFLGGFGFSDNYINKYIKCIKQVMNKAHIRGYHSNLAFKEDDWKVSDKPVDKTYLTEKEIERIRTTPLEGALARIRDTFVIGCYIGLRYSDLMEIKKDSIVEFRGIKMVRLVQSKTGELVTVPLKPMVLSLMSKYDGLPCKTNLVTFNQRLKDICRIAGIERYSMITSHTMRRSFATNLYLADMPSIDIMKVTGHKTESQFLKYIRVTKEQTAERMSEHVFFR